MINRLFQIRGIRGKSLYDVQKRILEIKIIRRVNISLKIGSKLRRSKKKN